MMARQHTLVIGAGTTGASVLRHLHGRVPLTLIDTRGEQAIAPALRQACPEVRYWPAADEQALRASIDSLLPELARAVVSPGLADDHWLLAALKAASVPVVTDIDLFFDALAGADARPAVPVISITGSNGKSTVATLTAGLLQAAGVNARAGGNLGPAALDLLADDVECYVLELSSFQLARSRCAPHSVATVLNVQADHLDYHGSLAAYAAAKQRIYTCAEKCVSPVDDALAAPEAAEVFWGITLAAPGPGQAGVCGDGRHRSFCVWPETAPAPRPLAPVSALRLAGAHNQRNALTALALVLAVVPDAAPAALAAGLSAYRGLPHRCEIVRELGGVRYINDSKATNVGATVAAVHGLAADPRDGGDASLVVLLGGDGKGADFTPLAQALAVGVRAAVVFGAAAAELQQALRDALTVFRCDTLDAALTQARSQARPGDTVLLSPACASFDQFRNFEDRGDAFRHQVEALAA
jgi:UDP-N-acetylmuramoylalanine--D-glutamate ligase